MFPGNQNAKNAPAAARPAGSGGTSAPPTSPAPAPHHAVSPSLPVPSPHHSERFGVKPLGPPASFPALKVPYGGPEKARAVGACYLDTNRGQRSTG